MDRIPEADVPGAIARGDIRHSLVISALSRVLDLRSHA